VVRCWLQLPMSHFARLVALTLHRVDRPMSNFARRLGPSRAPNVRELAGGSDVDDATLVARARDGDRGAEETLYYRHVRYITGMVARLLGSREEAEDVVQDTFAIALDELSKLRQPESLKAWLAQVAVSQVRRKMRRSRLLARLGLYPTMEHIDLESLAMVDATAEARAELAAIGRVLARVPTDERLAWMLRHVEGEPLDEVARLCRCSLATAKRRIAAAVRHLDEHLDDWGMRQ
jgi:RNA polymerase sigma-70 factor (ECF subfamily)